MTEEPAWHPTRRPRSARIRLKRRRRAALITGLAVPALALVAALAAVVIDHPVGFAPLALLSAPLGPILLYALDDGSRVSAGIAIAAGVFANAIVAGVAAGMLADLISGLRRG